MEDPEERETEPEEREDTPDEREAEAAPDERTVPLLMLVPRVLLLETPPEREGDDAEVPDLRTSVRVTRVRLVEEVRTERVTPAWEPLPEADTDLLRFPVPPPAAIWRGAWLPMRAPPMRWLDQR